MYVFFFVCWLSHAAKDFYCAQRIFDVLLFKRSYYVIKIVNSFILLRSACAVYFYLEIPQQQ